jgi:hypothetical protein
LPRLHRCDWLILDGSEGSPVRIRRGPATVTDEDDSLATAHPGWKANRPPAERAEIREPGDFGRRESAEGVDTRRRSR